MESPSTLVLVESTVTMEALALLLPPLLVVPLDLVVNISLCLPNDHLELIRESHLLFLTYFLLQQDSLWEVPLLVLVLVALVPSLSSEVDLESLVASADTTPELL